MVSCSEPACAPGRPGSRAGARPGRAPDGRVPDVKKTTWGMDKGGAGADGGLQGAPGTAIGAKMTPKTARLTTAGQACRLASERRQSIASMAIANGEGLSGGKYSLL